MPSAYLLGRYSDKMLGLFTGESPLHNVHHTDSICALTHIPQHFITTYIQAVLLTTSTRIILDPALLPDTPCESWPVGTGNSTVTHGRPGKQSS